MWAVTAAMPRKTFKLPRGICAHCHREAALLSDGRVHSRHVCPGAGQMPEALVERRVAMLSEGHFVAILELLNSHRDVAPGVVDRLLLDCIEQQQREISRLHNAMDDLRRVNDSHYQKLSKEIDRLKGVHGA